MRVGRPTTRDTILRELGHRLKTVRESTGLTQEDTAYKAEIDVKRFQRLENGKVNPTFITLHRVAKGLELTDVWELLDRISRAPAKKKRK